jgi:hypothetical protein
MTLGHSAVYADKSVWSLLFSVMTHLNVLRVTYFDLLLFPFYVYKIVYGIEHCTDTTLSVKALLIATLVIQIQSKHFCVLVFSSFKKKSLLLQLWDEFHPVKLIN